MLFFFTFPNTSGKQGGNAFVWISWQVVHIILITAFRARVRKIFIPPVKIMGVFMPLTSVTERFVPVTRIIEYLNGLFIFSPQAEWTMDYVELTDHFNM